MLFLFTEVILLILFSRTEKGFAWWPDLVVDALILLPWEAWWPHCCLVLVMARPNRQVSRTNISFWSCGLKHKGPLNSRSLWGAVVMCRHYHAVSAAFCSCQKLKGSCGFAAAVAAWSSVKWTADCDPGCEGNKTCLFDIPCTCATSSNRYLSFTQPMHTRLMMMAAKTTTIKMVTINRDKSRGDKKARQCKCLFFARQVLQSVNVWGDGPAGRTARE